MPLWSNPPQPVGGASAAAAQAVSASTSLSQRHEQDWSAVPVSVGGTTHTTSARQLLERIPQLITPGSVDVARQLAQHKRQAAAAAVTAAAVPQLRSFGSQPPQGQPQAIPAARPRVPMSPLVTSRACLAENHNRQRPAAAGATNQPVSFDASASRSHTSELLGAGVAAFPVFPSGPVLGATETVASADGLSSLPAAAASAGKGATHTSPSADVVTPADADGNFAAAAAAAGVGPATERTNGHTAVFVDQAQGRQRRQLQRRGSDTIFKSRPSSGSWPAIAAQAAAEAAAATTGDGGAGGDPPSPVAWPPQSPSFVNGKAYTGWGQTVPPLELGTSQAGAATSAMSS